MCFQLGVVCTVSGLLAAGFNCCLCGIRAMFGMGRGGVGMGVVSHDPWSQKGKGQFEELDGGPE